MSESEEQAGGVVGDRSPERARKSAAESAEQTADESSDEKSQYGADVTDILAALKEMVVDGAKAGVLGAAGLIFLAALVVLAGMAVVMLVGFPRNVGGMMVVGGVGVLLALAAQILGVGLAVPFRRVYLEGPSAVNGVGDAFSQAFGAFLDAAGYVAAMMLLGTPLIGGLRLLGAHAIVETAAMSVFGVILAPGLYLAVVGELGLVDAISEGLDMFGRLWVDIVWAALVFGLVSWGVAYGISFLMDTAMVMLISQVSMSQGMLLGMLGAYLGRALFGLALSFMLAVVLFPAMHVRFEIKDRFDQSASVWEGIAWPGSSDVT